MTGLLGTGAVRKKIGIPGALAVCICLGTLFAVSSGCTPSSSEESRTPEQTVDAFYEGLRSGNPALALSLLSRDVQIFEFGKVDRSRKDYAASHLQQDMEYAARVRRELVSRRGAGAEDERWVISAYREIGTQNDITQVTQTVILRRANSRWEIAHLHSSSDVYMPKTENKKP